MIATMEWNLIDSAPYDRNVELAVIDSEGAHALSFPCRRIEGGWIDVESKKRLYWIRPTHWRDWSPGNTLSEITRINGISLTLLPRRPGT